MVAVFALLVQLLVIAARLVLVLVIAPLILNYQRCSSSFEYTTSLVHCNQAHLKFNQHLFCSPASYLSSPLGSIQESA